MRELVPEFVDYIPEQLNPGVLYVSMRYATVNHLCCCGCGLEVVTTLSPTDWRLGAVVREGRRPVQPNRSADLVSRVNLVLDLRDNDFAFGSSVPKRPHPALSCSRGDRRSPLSRPV